MLKTYLYFLLVFATCCLVSRAELPPSAYEEMQRSAPEVLRVKVLRVETTPSGEKDRNVSALVQVLKVGRTASAIKPDDFITIRYPIVTRPAGWVGPGEVPLLVEGEERVAYLNKDQNSPDYVPAAGAMSFDRFN